MQSLPPVASRTLESQELHALKDNTDHTSDQGLPLSSIINDSELHSQALTPKAVMNKLKNIDEHEISKNT